MKNLIRRTAAAFCLLAGSGAAEQGNHFFMVIVFGILALVLVWRDMEHGSEYKTAAEHMGTRESNHRSCA